MIDEARITHQGTNGPRTVGSHASLIRWDSHQNLLRDRGHEMAAAVEERSRGESVPFTRDRAACGEQQPIVRPEQGVEPHRMIDGGELQTLGASRAAMVSDYRADQSEVREVGQCTDLDERVVRQSLRPDPVHLVEGASGDVMDDRVGDVAQVQQLPDRETGPRKSALLAVGGFRKSDVAQYILRGDVVGWRDPFEPLGGVFATVGRPLLGHGERGGHREDCFAVLDCADAPGAEGSTVAWSIHEVDDVVGCPPRSQEIGMERMHATVFSVDRGPSGHEGLRRNLSAKSAQWGTGVAPPREDVPVDSGELQTSDEVVAIRFRWAVPVVFDLHGTTLSASPTRGGALWTNPPWRVWPIAPLGRTATAALLSSNLSVSAAADGW